MEALTKAVTLPPARYQVEKKKYGRGYSIRIDGQKLISPSRALGVAINKPALVRWAARESVANIRGAIMDRLKGKDKARLRVTAEWVEEIIKEGEQRPEALKVEGGRVGSLLHDAFEEITLGTPAKKLVSTLMKTDKPLAESITGFEEWFLKSEMQIVGREQAVGSKKLGCGGILDALGYSQGKWGIIDYKTGSGVYWEAAIQTANYAICVEEQFGIKISWIRIVRVAKKEPFGVEVVPVNDMLNAKMTWMDCLDIYKRSLGNYLGAPTYSTFFHIDSMKKASAARKTAEERVKSGKAPF